MWGLTKSLITLGSKGFLQEQSLAEGNRNTVHAYQSSCIMCLRCGVPMEQRMSMTMSVGGVGSARDESPPESKVLSPSHTLHCRSGSF